MKALRMRLKGAYLKTPVAQFESPHITSLIFVYTALRKSSSRTPCTALSLPSTLTAERESLSCSTTPKKLIFSFPSIRCSFLSEVLIVALTSPLEVDGVSVFSGASDYHYEYFITLREDLSSRRCLLRFLNSSLIISRLRPTSMRVFIPCA